MFGRLGDPNGANNALSQVLYGLALRSVSRPSTPFPTIDAPNRHGWGCAQNEARAVQYLSLAAGNSADVEEQALAAGIKKGGAAKGELSLALFELANCFRHGWGVAKDASAARQYYETAANMGDLEAMNEVAWCYLEGFGCKKDKVRARFSHRPGVWRSVFQNVVERRGPSALEGGEGLATWCDGRARRGHGGPVVDVFQTPPCDADRTNVRPSQFKAAQYLRLAEEGGSNSVGNAWYVCPVQSFPTVSLGHATDPFWVPSDWAKKGQSLPASFPDSKKAPRKRGNHKTRKKINTAGRSRPSVSRRGAKRRISG
jgi:hypothetical protein